MRELIYISHANVDVDPPKPVPRWSLSQQGRERHERFGWTHFARAVSRVYSSDETKAVEAARASFPRFSSHMVVRNDMHENDRSSTGFLPPNEFEALADRFFAEPETSVRGWERAVDAQKRIVSACRCIVDETPDGERIAIVGHGGVGTLLFCHFAGVPIDRRHDQPANGGGNVIVLRFGVRIEISPWRSMESFE